MTARRPQGVGEAPRGIVPGQLTPWGRSPIVRPVAHARWGVFDSRRQRAAYLLLPATRETWRRFSMKRLRVWSALLVGAFVATGSFAQTNEDLQRQLNELKASMQNQQSKITRLEAENSALKTDRATPQDAGLE